MQFAALGELILIVSLILVIYQVKPHRSTKPLLAWSLMASCAFIAITASVGALKFLGIESLANTHQMLSFIATFFFMPIFAVAMARLFDAIDNRVAIALLIVAIPITSLASLFNTLVIITAIVLCIVQQRHVKWLIPGLLSLALVPASGVIEDQNIAMGLFHVFLALFFYCSARAIAEQK